MSIGSAVVDKPLMLSAGPEDDRRPASPSHSLYNYGYTDYAAWDSALGAGARAIGHRRSAKLVISPQRDEIAIEILTQRNDLRFEAATQLQHELSSSGGTTRARLDGEDRSKRIASRSFSGASALTVAPRRSRDRRSSHARLNYSTSSSSWKRTVRVVCLILISSIGCSVVDFQEAQHRAHRRLIVDSKIVVEEHQHLLW